VEDSGIPAADERTLVARARAGDREAFDRIVLGYQARLRGHVARYVSSSQDTYDIVQEVFLEAYRQLSKVDPEKPFGPWLWSICRHRLSDFFRRRYHRGHAIESLGLVDEALARLAAEPDPEEEDRSGSRLTALEGCVERLEDRHRRLLVLRYHHGLSLKDLAEKLQRSSAGLAMLLMRLRAKLEDCVRKRLGEAAP